MKQLRTIVTLESGWVFTGYEQAPGIFTDAACIRRWGTQNGLGQLALSGPTSNTTLDPCGTLKVSERKVIFRLDCPGWP